MILLIERGGRGREYALVDEKGALWDYGADVAPDGPAPEDIYRCRVTRVMPGLSAAFVELAPGLPGYLPLRPGDAPRGGEERLVQVRRAAQKDKAAFLSEDLAFTGRGLVYLPKGEGVKASRRLPREEKERQLARGRALAADGGLILRHNAAGLSDAELRAELARLRARWVYLQGESGAPRLLAKAESDLQKLLRDLNAPPEKAITDAPADGLPCPQETREQPFALYNVRDKLRKALGRIHPLKSGAVITVDPCEALTAIDVNSAHFDRRLPPNAARRTVNVEAAAEIARLARVRRLGGILVIDFLKMDGEEDRQAVDGAMRAAFADDPVQTTLEGFTRLGLYEMTRRRTQAGQEQE